MKGIILLGGSGTRLHPSTKVISKQLIPIYDKPMCYYSLSILFLSGIKDILIISTPHDTPLYQKLLGDGSQWGVNFSYIVQDTPAGLPQAFTLGESFIGNDSVMLVLGDNVFYGSGLTSQLKKAIATNTGTTIFAYKVTDPQRFGVVEVNDKGMAASIEEKPTDPKSDLAIVGLYICNNNVIQYSRELTPSKRGEYEIIDVLRKYMSANSLKVEKFGRGITWLDTGTHDSLLQASNFVQTIQQRQGQGVACLEEIAFNQGWITKEQLLQLASEMKNNPYSQYLIQLVED